MEYESLNIEWEQWRRENGTINLCAAALATGCYFNEPALRYLKMVEKQARITSRQIAAVAVASAMEISARSAALMPDTKEKA